MWKTVSRAGEFKGETPNAQRRTPNIGPECAEDSAHYSLFRHWMLNVERWTLNIRR